MNTRLMSEKLKSVDVESSRKAESALMVHQEAGAQVNEQDELGNTVLHFIIKAGKPDPERVRCLLSFDMDRLIKNKDGFTAEQLIKSNIVGVELCAKIYAAFYDVNLQSRPLSKLKVMPSLRYEKLRKRYASVGLKNPNQYTMESLDDVVQEACKIRASTNRLMVMEVSDGYTQSHNKLKMYGDLITMADLESANLKKIRSYLLNKGNPNLTINPDNQSLIIYAMDRKNLYLVLELLRFGAKLHLNDIKDSDSNKEMLLTITNELALDVRLIKALVDKNNERENRQLHDLLLCELIQEQNDQENLILNKGRITPRDNRDIKCKNSVIDICNIPILSEVKYNQNSYTSTLGLLSLYSPIEILYSLLELLPDFTGCQKLGSVILMKFVFLHAWKFGHELPSLNHLRPYFHQLQNDGISNRLKNVYLYMYEFSQNPTLKSYVSLNSMTATYSDSSVIKLEKAIDVAISDKKSSLNEISRVIANELIILTARYYHQCELIDVHHLEKIDHFCIKHEDHLVTGLKAFIQKVILSQDTIKKCERAIKLFIHTAKICLTNTSMMDLNSVAVIVEAINSKWITRLQISLDKKTLAAYNDLKDIVSRMNDFKMHREFIKTYKYCLPWIEVIKKNLDSVTNTYQLSQVQLLGEAFEPLIALKDRLDLYRLKSNSDLNLILRHINITDDTLKNLSVALRAPETPNLSHKYSIEDFKKAIHDQRLTQSPLTIKYNHGIYVGETALSHIKKWTDEMKRKFILTDEEAAQIYFGCQTYHTQNCNPPINKIGKNTTDLTASESHKFFVGFKQKSSASSSASEVNYVNNSNSKSHPDYRKK